MAKLKGTHHVVSAALTDTGAPAYLAEGGRWSAQFADAVAFEDGKLAEQHAQSAAKQEQHAVCDPYTFMVLVDGARPVAISARERIRAEGPTVQVRRPD